MPILGVRILLMTIISSGRMSKWMFGYVTVPRRVSLVEYICEGFSRQIQYHARRYCEVGSEVIP